MADRRQYYRLTFPVAERPRLRLDGQEYDIVEMSEGGVTIELAGRPAPGRGQSWSVVVQMADGVELAASGSVKRTEGSERLTLQFHELLPWKALVDEQRRLLARYPRKSRT